MSYESLIKYRTSKNNSKSSGWDSILTRHGYATDKDGNVVVDLKSITGDKNYGKVSRDAYKAIESGTLDSYKPKDYEKDVISKFRTDLIYPVTTQDGVYFGDVSYDAYMAISNDKIGEYTPVSDRENVVISSLKNSLGYGKTFGSVNRSYARDKYGYGNIDLTKRPVVVNDDNTISTVDSISIDVDGKEVLIPTVVWDENGKAKRLTEKEATEHYKKTGEHLGVFDSVNDANKYAMQLHVDQDLYYRTLYGMSDEEKDVIKRYDIDISEFDYDDLRKWAKEHNHQVQMNTTTMQMYIAPKYKGGFLGIGGKKQSSSQEDSDAKILEKIAEKNVKEEFYETKLGKYIKPIATAGETLAYTAENVAAGGLGGIEKSGDWILGGAAWLGSKAADVVVPDRMGNAASDKLKRQSEFWINKETQGDKWSQSAESRYIVPQWIRDNLGTTATSFGEMIPSLAIEIYSGGTAPTKLDTIPYEMYKLWQGGSKSAKALNTAKQMVTRLTTFKPSDIVFGSSAAKSYAQSGLQMSGDIDKAMAYGALGGLGEVMTEKLDGGYAGTGIGADTVDSLIDFSKSKYFKKLANTKIEKFLNGKIAKKTGDFLGEMYEEALMAEAEPIFQKLTVNPDAKLADMKDLTEGAWQGLLLSLFSNAAMLPINKYQKNKTINILNEASDKINLMVKDDVAKLEPLSYKATEKEIKARQEQIKTFEDAYVIKSTVDAIVSNPEFVSEVTKQAEGTSGVSVGTILKNAQTGQTAKVVSRDATTTVFEVIDKNGNVGKRTYDNENLDKAIAQGRIVVVGDESASSETAVAENATTTTETTPTNNTETKTISLTRMGDFYEMYGDNALALAENLDMETTRKVVNGVETDVLAIPTNIADDWANAMAEDGYTINFSDKPTITPKNESVVNETETTDETTPSEEKTDTIQKMDAVISAMEETLTDKAKEDLQNGQVKENYDRIADSIIKRYKAEGSLKAFAPFFIDGGKKVESAIKDLLGETTTESSKETDVSEPKALKNEPESDMIESTTENTSAERKDGNNEQIRESVLHEDGERGNNKSTRKYAGDILSDRRQTDGRTAKERQNFARELIERGQTEQVTIEDNTIELVNPEAYNDDMLSMFEKAKRKGKELGFFVGEGTLTVVRTDGTKQEKLIDGFVTTDGKMYVQYDADRPPQSLFKHEFCHEEWNTPEMQKAANTILSPLTEKDKEAILSTERYKTVLDGYTAYFRGDTNKAKALIWEEFVCDVMADMNDYTPVYADVVADYWNENETSDTYKVAEYSESTDTGDDNKFSFSSIGATFFGDESISSEEFEKMLEDGSYKKHKGYIDYVKECVKVYRQSRGIKDMLSASEAKKIEQQIEGIMRVAIAAKKAGYDIFDDGKQRSKKDSKKRLLFSSLEPNSDYVTSSDVSTICDKAKNFTEIHDAIIKLEEERGVPDDQRFFKNIDNYFILHKLLADKGLTIPCDECYVQSMRKNLTPMADAFRQLVQEENPNNKDNEQLYHKDGKDKGNIKKNNAEIRKKVRELCESADCPIKLEDLTVKMLTTADGLATLRCEAPLLYETFNSFYGQSKPKMPREATPFRPGELIAMFTNSKGQIKTGLVNKIKATGGFRLQSYSDFQIKNYVDVLQTIFEASMVGLNGHAYTKVPAFLEATEGTNLKRNISIFMYEDGGEWKLDKKNSFPMELEDIYSLVATDESGNTSIIAVSQNESMSAWIMANDNVGYGIPFHKSGTRMEVVRGRIVKTPDGREILGYANQKDHTKQQTEVWKTTVGDNKENTKVKKPINIYSFWDFKNKDNLSKKELIEKNLKRYIDECNKNNYRPKFRDYLMDNADVLNNTLKYAKELGFVSQDATIDDISFKYDEYTIPYGYYKFLGDFGMFNAEGKASPIEVLSLENYDFDKAVDFFKDSSKLRINELLQQFENGKVRDKYRKMIEDGELTIEQLDDILKEKRREIAEEVVDFADSGVRFSFREEAPPKKTVVGYKVFVVKDGKLYPPMVANPDGADTPVGVWLNADVGEPAPDSKTGRKQVKAGGKGTQGGSGSLAFRPGWHLGEIPIATQFNRLNAETGVKELFPENFVWAECEVAADIDYQEEAMSYGYTDNGKFRHSYAGLPKLPVDGYYKYRTNPNPETIPWLITGAMKVNRVLSDAEVAKILQENGIEPPKRKGGEKTLKDLGLERFETTKGARFSFAENSYAPTFYSHMSRTIDGMKDGKYGANSVVPYLKGKGVKNEEIKWSGIEDFLDGKKSVIKAELQEFVAGNQLQIEEKTLSSNPTLSYTEDESRSLDEISTVEQELWDEIDDIWWNKYESEMPWDIRFANNSVNALRRELNKRQRAESDDERVSEIYSHLNRIETLERNRDTIVNRARERAFEEGRTETRYDKYTLDGGSKYRELLFKLPNSKSSNSAMRTHWGEEGILAHARIQDFEVDGKKMLFIEEIQSDWHNEGHKNGYQGDKVDTISVEDTRLVKEGNLYKLYSRDSSATRELTWIGAFAVDRLVSPNATNDDIQNYLVDSYNRQVENGTLLTTPDAPFRDNYHEYVLKNLIRMAAEQGYDSIGWTPADVQSKRWSDEYAEGYRIEYDQDIPKFLNKYGKKWGAKVGRDWLLLNEDLDEQNVWSMDITDSMRQSVLYEGQPRYSFAENKSSDSLDTQKKIEKIAKEIGSHEEFIELAKQNTQEFVDKVKENKSLQKRLKNAKRQMLVNPNPVVNVTMAGKVTKDILTEMESTLKAKDLQDEVISIYTEHAQAIKKSGGVESKVQEANDTMVKRFSALAVDIADSAETFVESEMYTLLKSYVKETRIKIPDYAKEEAHFAEFRKSHMGTFNLTNDGLDIDMAYAELCDMFPGLFDSEVSSPADQLYAIADQLDALKPYAYNPHSNYMQDAIDHIVYRFVSEADGITAAPKTKAQKMAEKAKLDKDMALEKERENFERKLDKQKATSEKNIQALQKKINDAKYVQYWEKRLSKEEKQEAVQKVRDNQKKSVLKSKIRNIVADMKKHLDKTEKNGGYPKELVKAAADVCSVIDFRTDRTNKDGTPTKTTLKLDALRNQYDALKDSPNYDFQTEYSEEISERIRVLNQSVGNKRVIDLTLDELSRLKDILSEIHHSLSIASKQIGIDNAKANYEIFTEIVNDLEQIDVTNWKHTILKGESWVINPNRIFEMVANYNKDSAFWKLYEGILRGERGRKKFTMDATMPFDELTDGGANEVAFYDFRTKAYKTGIKYADGTEVEIPKSIICELVMLWERNDGKKHLASGGIKIPDMKQFNKGKTRDAMDDGKLTRPITQADITKLRGMLDSYDKAWINRAYHLFNKVGKDAINKTSMQLVGREIAKAKNYIRAYVDSDFVRQEIDKKNDNITLEGHGSLKETTPDAKNPVVLRGLHENVYDHIDFVAKYSNLAIPIRNFNKVYKLSDVGVDGHRSIKSMLAKKFGSAIRDDVIVKTINELQYPRPKQISLFQKVRGNWLNATFFANVKSMLKQTTSYWTASSILDESSLLAGLKNYVGHSKQTKDEIAKYSGTLYGRSQGLSTTELGDRANRKRLAGASSNVTKAVNKYAPWLRKIPEGVRPENWLQSMDVNTSAALWEACKHQVSKTMDRSDDGYMKAVTDLYERVIEETQSNYDVLHRPEILKSEGLKTISMFQNDNLQQTGILKSAYSNLRAKQKAYESNSSEANKKALDEASKRMYKAVSARIYSSLWMAMISVLGDTLLRKFKPYIDDEEKEITASSVLEQMRLTMCEDMLGVFVPVAGDLLKRAKDTVVNGYDFMNEPSLDVIDGFIKTSANIAKEFYKEDGDVWKAISGGLRDISNMTGIPAKNVYDLYKSVKGYIGDIKVGKFAHDLEEYTSGNKSFYSYGDLASYIVSGNTDKEQKFLDYYSANGKEFHKGSFTKEMKPAYVQMHVDSPEKAKELRKKLILEYDYTEQDFVDWMFDEYLKHVVPDVKFYDGSVSDSEYAAEIKDAIPEKIWKSEYAYKTIRSFYKEVYKNKPENDAKALRKSLENSAGVSGNQISNWEKEADEEIKKKEEEQEKEKDKYR